MAKKSFKVGDKVVLLWREKLSYDPFWDDWRDNYDTGIVREVSGNGWYEIEYESDFAGSDMRSIHYKDLLHVSELEKKMPGLEAEFKAVEKEITIKMKQAGNLLIEANRLANKAGSSLSQFCDALETFERAMEKIGWNTSSLNC